MKRKKLEIAYVGLSLFLLITANPGYDLFSTWAVILLGPAGSLLLAWDCIQDVIYKDLSQGWHFSTELGFVFLFALLFWLAGFMVLFHRKKFEEKYFRVIAISILWIIGSFYNLFWFGILSL